MSRVISHSLRWKPPTLSMPKHQQLPSGGQVAVACPVNRFSRVWQVPCLLARGLVWGVCTCPLAFQQLRAGHDWVGDGSDMVACTSVRQQDPLSLVIGHCQAANDDKHGVN